MTPKIKTFVYIFIQWLHIRFNNLIFNTNENVFPDNEGQ